MDSFEVLAGIDSGIIYYNSLANPQSRTLKYALFFENGSKLLWSKANLVYTKTMMQLMRFRDRDFFEPVANKFRWYVSDIDHVSQKDYFIGTLNYGVIPRTKTIPYSEVKAYNLRIAKLIYAKKLFEHVQQLVPKDVYDQYFAKDIKPFMDDLEDFDRLEMPTPQQSGTVKREEDGGERKATPYKKEETKKKEERQSRPSPKETPIRKR